MNYVYSTLTCDTAYVIYQKTTGGLTVPADEILIKGGAGLANDRLQTPLGVATQVSDTELALLKTNSVFNEQLKNGFLTVQESGKEEDADKVAVDMASRDGGAPLNEQIVEEKAAVTKSKKGK